MDETKHKSSAYSSNLSGTAVAERQAEAKEIAESLAGNTHAEPAKASRYAPVTVSQQSADSSPIQDFLGFVKQTRRIWLMVAGGIFGLFVLVMGVSRLSEWFTKSRERRQEKAVATVSPERLLARCGQPLEDTTKDMYPILLRTMTYQVSRTATYIFDFSRTAEEKSDWVFLSMKDTNGKSYETPEEKVGAMSCIDSRK